MMYDSSLKYDEYHRLNEVRPRRPEQLVMATNQMEEIWSQ